MNPIIFLDIDGTMNSKDHFDGEHGENWPVRSVKALNAIIAGLPGCDIIISSSWRYWFDDAQMQAHLDRNGVVGAKVVGHTPKHYTERLRGQAIDQWLKENPGHKLFVILDDDWQTAPHEASHVKTTWLHGLMDEHVQPALDIVAKQRTYAEMADLAKTREPHALPVACECGGGLTGCADCFGDGFRPRKEGE